MRTLLELSLFLGTGATVAALATGWWGWAALSASGVAAGLWLLWNPRW